MPKLEYGFSPQNTSKPQKNVGGNYSITSNRVIDIILDDKHPLFDKYGGWNSIGLIFIESTKNPSSIVSEVVPSIIAYPAFPNIKHYPLINELVPILYLTDIDSTNNTTSISAYYLPPINVWNSSIHNGIPSSNIIPNSQNKNYQQTELGSTNIISDENVNINLGKTFKENDIENVNPLLQYEGDITYEGRFGNSIRFGSTVGNANIPNSWSKVGKNGSPILIIRNGQFIDPQTENWIPILEDINKDKSSIYITSNQQIDINLSSNNNNSFDSSEAPSGQFTDSQIILNSDRLIFNSKKESIILSSQKYIHITSQKGINFDTNGNFVINSKNIYLGDKKATESAILGSTFIKDFNLLVNSLNILCTNLAPISTVIPTITPSLVNLKTQCENISTHLEDYLSKNIKLK